MRRQKHLLEKRKQFVFNYINNKDSDKRIGELVKELTEILFLSERTIYNIIDQINKDV